MKIDDEIITNCWLFAHKVTETTKHYYLKRNPDADIQKLIKDHYFGKLAEWYVYYYLKEKGYCVTFPDMSIKTSVNKSFDADLIVNKKNHIHVKSCKAKHRSVLFEKYELEQIKLLPYQYVVVVQYNTFKDMKIGLFKSINDCKFGEPNNKNLITKTALYF